MVLAPSRPRIEIARYVIRVPDDASRVKIPVHTFGGIDRLRAFHVTGSAGGLTRTLVGSVDIRDVAESAEVEFDIPASARAALSARGVALYRVEGVRAQTTVFGALFELRDELEPKSIGPIDLASDLRVATRSHSDPQIGWQLDATGALVAHAKGDLYPAGMYTLAEFQLARRQGDPAHVALHLGAIVQNAFTDVFYVIVRDADERELTRRAFFGSHVLSGELLDLSQFLDDGPITIQLVFVSDTFTSGAPGVRIGGIEVK
jgi:hypothetical protein